MRYNKTERLGVNETDKIVTKYLGWIFREQSIADFGIDGIIEQVEEGNPTGKFIGVQIKSGSGNFHDSENKIIYYATNIHYNYWLNLNIPIILVAHFPETEITYWQEIDKRKFQKTNKNWKLEIPKTQVFSEKSKNRLTKVLSNHNHQSLIFDVYKGEIDSNKQYNLVEKIHCIPDSLKCFENIADTINEGTVLNNNFILELNELLKQGYSDNDWQIKTKTKQYARAININSNRLRTEILLFSELFGIGIHAYEQSLLLLHKKVFKHDNYYLGFNKMLVMNLPTEIQKALNAFDGMRYGISKIPKKYSVLKEAKKTFLGVIDILVFEFKDADTIVKNMIEEIDLRITNANNV